MFNIPHIEVESSYGIREVVLSTRHLMNRNIFIQGEIDSGMANSILSEFLFLVKTEYLFNEICIEL